MEAIINGSLTDFTDWYDTDGHIINASDGGILFAEGRYHWYGQALRPLPMAGKGLGGQTTTTGVVMYASDDLLHWDFEGVILSCSEDPAGPLYAPMRFERPKIIFNDRTGQYVLWCHYVGYPGDHGDLPGTAEAGVAVCDTVNGSYRWLGTCRPIDDSGLVRDCTLFKDRDGRAYFLFDRQESPTNRCQHIVELSEDYLSMTDHWKRLDSVFWREAAAVVYHDGWYFMITSDLTSWAFNRAKYFRARNVMGPWEDMGDPCIGDEDHLTFHSQTTFIFPVEGTDTVVHMAERHNTENFERCSYIWLPIDFDDAHHTLSLRYRTSWRIPEGKCGNA